MDLKKWGSENITDFSGKIKTEEYEKYISFYPICHCLALIFQR